MVSAAEASHLYHSSILLNIDILAVNQTATVSFTAHSEQLQEEGQEDNDLWCLNVGVFGTFLKNVLIVKLWKFPEFPKFPKFYRRLVLMGCL